MRSELSRRGRTAQRSDLSGIESDDRNIAGNAEPGFADGMKSTHEMFRAYKHQRAAAHGLPARR